MTQKSNAKMNSNKMSSSSRKTRYAICGLSIRGTYHFVLPLLGKSPYLENEDYSDCSEVVGILEPDRTRVEVFFENFGIRNIPVYSLQQGVEEMIRETRPDALLVAGPDYTHYEYIMAGLKHNLRVISEKPVVINSQQMQDVLSAEKSSKGSLTVAHNYRYTVTNQKIKELLLQDKIGRIVNVEFVYNLDTEHGSSYFYRWNRVREKSGGLSIHKSVHHMDFINWLVCSVPETVFAFGGLNYYGANGAHRPRGADGKPLDLVQTKAQCPYFQKHYASKGQSPEEPMLLGWDKLKMPYDFQYPKDRYIYDEEIDVEDTYSAVIRYQNGVSMTYSCNFSTPWEGYVLAINGTEGRLEVSHHSDPDPTGNGLTQPQQDKIKVTPLFGVPEEHVVDLVAAGHGGADPLIRHDLFRGLSAHSLQYQLPADSYAGAVAVAAGEAIWRSAVDGRPYTLRELLGEHYRERA